ARGARGLAAGGSPTDPVEAERYCAVPRNDPRNQAMQPKPRQVEWAVDQAITDSLRVTREANWKNLGMPAYSPQGLFPSIPLLGGGRVPAQVMLGIIAQESNMWQAPGFVLPGATGNPLIGNYYGRDIYNSDPADDWDINWADADCGYGVAQVTDGMRLAGREKPNERAHEYQTQRAVALDFATNVAAGVRILQDKWNQVRTANMLVNNGSAAKLENWFFAVWAYNSGFHPDRGDGKPWGVGWLNNPINPRFDPQRSAFLDNNSYDDARTPQKWPYPEKVLGWAGHPVEINESPTTLVAGFRPAWWISDAERRRVKPPIDLFCDQTNRCDPTASVQADDPEVAGEPPGPCLNKNDSGRYDLRCWYNQSVQWKGGPGTSCNACGNEVLRFDPGFPYEPDGASYPPNCGPGGLPGTGALIIDDVPDDVPSVRAGCPRSWRNAGTFAFGFPADQHGNYPAKVDLHQIGGGFGGHFSFGRTRHVGADDGKLRIAGTWRLAEPASGWHRVRVAIPDHRAWTQQADYVLDLGDGRTRHRVISQAWNRNTWVDLGVFNLAGRAGITLATETMDGTGEDSIAWDAVAFIPTTAPTVQYVAMGDSYASGEGVEPYVPTSDHKRDNGTRNACHRSYHAYPQHLTRPGAATPIAQEAAAGRASFGFIACSGALTTSVTRDAVNRPASTTDIGRHTDWAVVDYRHGELPQADQGWLDEETTLVTLSIGGNDARFTDVLHGCIVVNPAEGCYADGHRLTRRSGVVDPVALRHFETAVILNHLPAKLTATYRAIHAKAPNATIVVTGYPQLFPDRPLQTCQGVTVTTQRFLNNLSGMLTATTAKAVAAVHAEGVDIVFADPNIAWRTGVGDSSRWACPTGSAGSWTNLLINWSETGSGRDVPGAGSFHPKQEGQLALATMAGLGLRAPTAVGAVADRIRDGAARLGVTITPAAAQDAARACLDRSRIGGVVGDPCANQPIFFPSATDAGGAARNDAEAMDANPPWVLLRYARNTEMEKLLDRGWMDKEPARSQQTACPKPRPTNMQCDEYPYYSSDLAGAWDEFLGENSPVSTKLKLIPRGENTAEGSRLPHFYSRCGLQSATYDATTKVQTGVGDRYLTVPLLHGGAPGTFYICPPPS
ncbi:MAG TPA: SGNH/GDSL hydrolase family protein, partial [Pilimelia sp.]|nr:SGNH/GDSL hydrolase family protein [Pilimelia sp.]